VLANRDAEVEAVLAAAEKSVPDDLNPYYQAGRVLYTQNKNLPQAEKYLRKYLTQEAEGGTPSLAHAHWRLALVLEKQNRKPEAITELQTALRLNLI